MMKEYAAITIGGLNTSRGCAKDSFTLANGRDLDQLLLSIQKNDSKPLPIQKAHFGTEVCNCLGTINPSRTTAIVIGTGETVSRGASLSQPSIKS